MDEKTNAIIGTLQSQRNAALDMVAALQGELAKLRKETQGKPEVDPDSGPYRIEAEGDGS